MLIARTRCLIPKGRDDEGMAARLLKNAFAGIDKQDSEVSGRSAGRHIAGVLFVARRVGDNEFAFLGSEIAIGDIDRDALLALGGEAINQQGEINLFALRAHAAGLSLKRFHLIFEDLTGIVQEAADQC